MAALTDAYRRQLACEVMEELAARCGADRTFTAHEAAVFDRMADVVRSIDDTPLEHRITEETLAAAAADAAAELQRQEAHRQELRLQRQKNRAQRAVLTPATPVRVRPRPLRSPNAVTSDMPSVSCTLVSSAPPWCWSWGDGGFVQFSDMTTTNNSNRHHYGSRASRGR